MTDTEDDPIARNVRAHDAGWQLGQIEGALGVLVAGATAYLADLERRFGRRRVAEVIVALRAFGPHVRRASSPALQAEVDALFGASTPDPGAKSGAVDWSICSSCGAAIVWGVTARGSRVPLDPDPVELVVGLFDPAGAMVSVVDDAGVVVRGLRADSDDGRAVLEALPLAERRTCRISHFATCPNAGQHRRPRATVGNVGSPAAKPSRARR